jgi:hypothetical protein
MCNSSASAREATVASLRAIVNFVIIAPLFILSQAQSSSAEDFSVCFVLVPPVALCLGGLRCCHASILPSRILCLRLIDMKQELCRLVAPPGKCMLRCLYCIFVVLTCHESAVSFDHIVFWIVAPDWWPGHETIDRIRWFLIIITTTLDLQ